ncbi:Early nodulin-like protein 2 [Linum grandiflorum]
MDSSSSSHKTLTAFSTVITAAAFLFIVTSSEAYQFPVGGKQGWVVDPQEKYPHWAERLRFQINDTLYFKYEKGMDSVLVVNKSQYDSCNTSAPVQSLIEGDSIVQLDRSGPFFFISGFTDHCSRGQKLVVVVLSEHHHKKTTSPPAPSPRSPVVAPPPRSSVVAPPPSDDDETSSPAAAPTPAAAINSGAGARFSAGLTGLVGLGVMMLAAAGFVGVV